MRRDCAGDAAQKPEVTPVSLTRCSWMSSSHAPVVRSQVWPPPSVRKRTSPIVTDRRSPSRTTVAGWLLEPNLVVMV